MGFAVDESVQVQHGELIIDGPGREQVALAEAVKPEQAERTGILAAIASALTCCVGSSHLKCVPTDADVSSFWDSLGPQTEEEQREAEQDALVLALGAQGRGGL